jgi:hypothetical protein
MEGGDSSSSRGACLHLGEAGTHAVTIALVATSLGNEHKAACSGVIFDQRNPRSRGLDLSVVGGSRRRPSTWSKSGSALAMVSQPASRA